MTARDRRALRWGAGTILAALLALRVVPDAVRAAGAWQARSAARQATLGQTRRLLGELPQLRDSLSRLLPAVVALAPRLLDGRTPTEVSASLAALVTLDARQHALAVVRVDPLPDAVAGAFTRVTVHAELEGDVRGLVAMLQMLETGDPLLTLESLSVDAPDEGSASNHSERLRMEFTIAGYGLVRGTP